jgi:subtilisin family serine protease
MLSARRIVVAAALCATASLALAPGARADSIDQQAVLDMMNVPAAWQQTQGDRVTVAVIDSGVDPDVSDLMGSVITGPDLSGVSTRPSDPNWGKHGTWMASLIAGHGHDGGGSGVIGIAPQSKILSIRVIPDQTDPHYRAYEH